MQMKPQNMTISELIDLRSRDMLKVNPEYQRGAVWNEGQQKRLIDSVMRGYPIPLIYLHKITDSVKAYSSTRLEVIDGQQRLDALWSFYKGDIALFHPVKDASRARFPAFVRDLPCPWGGKRYEQLEQPDRERFNDYPIAVYEISVDHPNEVRDLFIRLQAGRALGAQEQRDAWPGNFTDFILKTGGKPKASGYRGHEFFEKVMKIRTDAQRLKARTLCAQMLMLLSSRHTNHHREYPDLTRRHIDDFYYRHLDFDASGKLGGRLKRILDVLTDIITSKTRKGLLGHETMHLALLVDDLLDDYTPSWQDSLAVAFDDFRLKVSEATRAERKNGNGGEYWSHYGAHTRTSSNRGFTIQRRHQFFATKLIEQLTPVPLDSQRIFGTLERDIIYARDGGKCCVCHGKVNFDDAEIHHVNTWASGGVTELSNGATVHMECHPKSVDATKKFAFIWQGRRQEV
jgi:hypothetical protein